MDTSITLIFGEEVFDGEAEWEAPVLQC